MSSDHEKIPPDRWPCGIILFDSCLNDVFDIAPTIKDADDADGLQIPLNRRADSADSGVRITM